MTWLQFSIYLLATLLAIEVGLWRRWRSIEAMFDRALMHGGSLDTLSRALREDSAAATVKAEEAKEAAHTAIDAVTLLHHRVKALEEHPFLRPLGGPGVKEGL